MEQLATRLGLPLDLGSAGAIHASLEAARATLQDPGAGEALTMLLTKPMQLAAYFCTADVEPDQWGHYALAMQHYTHFTSPIR